MKKIIISFMLLFSLLSNLNARSIELNYNDSVQKIKNYADNFANSKKYIKDDVSPFIYNGETVDYDEDFYGSSGLLNVDEFILARNYIYNGLNFWMIKGNDEEEKYFSVDSAYDGYVNDETNPENTSGIRPTLYVKDSTYVKGIGSRMEPWEFVEPFIVKIETSDQSKGLLKPNTNSDGEVSLTQTVYKGGMASAIVLPEQGYEFAKTDNNDDCFKKVKNSNIETKDIEIKNIETGAIEKKVIETVFLKDIIADLNCKIYFDAIKYKLTINPNGGKYNGKTDVSYETGTINELKQINVPTAPAGHVVTFNTNGGNSVAPIQAQKEFVTWSLSAGKGSVSIDGFKFEDDNATIIANYDDVSINLPTPTRNNYTFLGWYTKQTSGELVSSPYTPKSNVTLYAHWIENKQGLMVDPGEGTWNGTAGITNLSDTPGKTVTINNPIPPKGYTVSFNSNGGNNVNSIVSSKTFNNWELKGGGTFTNGVYTFSTENGTLTAKYSNNTITLPTPTRNNYKFLGWYTSLTSTDKVETEYTPTKDIILYAKWEKEKSTLTINPNGGKWNNSSSNSKFTAEIGSTKTISNPTKAGYTVTFNANGGSTSVKSKTSTEKFTSWTKSGGGSFSNTTFTFGKSNATLTANYSHGSITLPKPSKKYYNFDGWYTKESGGTKVGMNGDTYEVKDKRTLYAHWSEKTINGKIAEEFKCLNSTTTRGNIYIWRAKSSCDNFSTSGCGYGNCSLLGVLGNKETICVVGIKSNYKNYKSVVAWVKGSSITSKGKPLTNSSECASTEVKTIDGTKVYKARVTAYCNNASCGYTWVLGTNAKSFFK